LWGRRPGGEKGLGRTTVEAFITSPTQREEAANYLKGGDDRIKLEGGKKDFPRGSKGERGGARVGPSNLIRKSFLTIKSWGRSTRGSA